MSFDWKQVSNLSIGVNYRNLVASVNTEVGEAQDASNVFPREDGAIYKAFGWNRINPAAVTGIPVAQQGFTYRGKNTASGDTRLGNLGQPNDGADFTRRVAEYGGFLLLTTTNAYVWDPINEKLEDVTADVPVGVNITQETKPTMQVAKDNVYIVGWSDKNLRYDPTDAKFYQWGWEQVPDPPSVAPGSGDLITTAAYQYSVSFQDLYTGEESKMSDLVKVSGSGGYNIDVSGVTYTGNRHFASGGTASDVAIVIWRTGNDDDAPRFLAQLLPGQTTFVDDGVGRDSSLRPFRGVQEDEPRFSALREFKGSFYALSKSSSSNRLYFSYFDRSAFLERWVPLNFVDLEVPDGEFLTAVGGTDVTFLAFSQRGAFRLSISNSVTERQANGQRMPWHVGCVGPGARQTVDGWEYFTSERGPYRWKEGLTGPQEIAEFLLPIFVDPASGLCKLTPRSRELCEIEYEWETNTVHCTFPLGDADRVTNHLAYWHSADRVNGDFRKGWFPQSSVPQAMSLTSGLSGSTGGVPDSPRIKKPALTWSDEDGYLNEFQPERKRAALPDGEVAFTTVDSVSNANTIKTTDSGLYNTDDGMRSMRMEIESQPDANGDTTVEVYKIASNTGNEITIVDAAFSRTPVAGDTVRLGGIPAFWRSWFDHFGMPHQHKTMMDFSLGYQDRVNPLGSITVNIGRVDSLPQTPVDSDFKVQVSAVMDKSRKKFTVSQTGVFFFYEFSNSIPDELFLITNFEREVQAVPGRRLA